MNGLKKIKSLVACLAAVCMLMAAAGCAEERTPPSQADKVSEAGTDPASTAGESPVSGNGENNLDNDAVTLVQFQSPSQSERIVVLKTSKGEIRLRLFPEQAPKAVENFITLAEEGYYNGLTFHSVIRNGLMEAGDPSGDGSGGQSAFAADDADPGYFEDEFSMHLWHFRGALSMVHMDGQPGTNNSQFSIVQGNMLSDQRIEDMKAIKFPEKVIAQYQEVGGAPHLDWKCTVFGMVADEESMEVVDQIAAVKVEDPTAKNYKPVESILIENVEVVK